jgi:hypothetical protein
MSAQAERKGTSRSKSQTVLPITRPDFDFHEKMAKAETATL